MPLISVVVPTYNEEAGIEDFLSQFEAQTLPREEFEVVVVDGDSTDATREIASRHADQVILQTSSGIGGARNDGVEAARAPIVATTDADVVLPRNWLELILGHFEDPEVVAVCGPDGPIEGGLKARATFLLLRTVIRAFTLLGVYTTGGGNSAFRRDVVLRIGGYKPLPHSDDVEIAFRLKREGRIVYDPRLFVRVSARRMEKNGYAKTLLTWLRGDLKVLFGGDIEDVAYARQRY
jgi:glycosyltransferase involved in cell wall biosynthesis